LSARRTIVDVTLIELVEGVDHPTLDQEEIGAGGGHLHADDVPHKGVVEPGEPERAGTLPLATAADRPKFS
jgi:hypothetical protein